MLVYKYIVSIFCSRTLAVGQTVVCKQGTDELWKPGVIESVENDNHLCVVRFTHFNALEAIPFESIITTSRIRLLNVQFQLFISLKTFPIRHKPIMMMTMMLLLMTLIL